MSQSFQTAREEINTRNNFKSQKASVPINAHKLMQIKLSSINLAGPKLYKYSEQASDSKLSLPNKKSPARSINGPINFSPEKGPLMKIPSTDQKLKAQRNSKKKT